MMKQGKQDIRIKLCTDCFNCKKKKNLVYCKLGVWKETDNGKSILHTPFDFGCNKWDEV
jgi:hypothetical protein